MTSHIAIRPNAEHANVAALQDAYEKMQAFSGSDNRSWIYWAAFHGFNRFECWHHARVGNDEFPYDLFLPWHRAYLAFFDNAVRDQNPNAILPWWDWTSDASHQTGLPAAYTSGASSLQSGPLTAMNGQPERRTTRNPGNPAELPSPEELDDLLDLTDFRDFSDQLQDIHDGIHGWVGGDMGSIATSAFEPVFWAHHTMIDRAWYLWQQRHGVTNIPVQYLDRALFPGLTVQQVLDVRALGYDYAAASVAVGTEVPPGVSPSDGGGVPVPEGEDSREPRPTTTAPKYTSETLNVGALHPDARRIDIEFHNVDHAGASYEGRVYINKPDADESTGYEDPSYAGSYHIFRARRVSRGPRALRSQAAAQVRSAGVSPAYSGQQGRDHTRRSQARDRTGQRGDRHRRTHRRAAPIRERRSQAHRGSAQGRYVQIVAYR